MKNTTMTTILLLFAYISNAQGPYELQCTEEAFTFKANISSGWHFSTPSFGKQQFPSTKRGNSLDWSAKFNYTSSDAILFYRKKPVDTRQIFQLNTTAVLHNNYFRLPVFKGTELLDYKFPDQYGLHLTKLLF